MPNLSSPNSYVHPWPDTKNAEHKLIPSYMYTTSKYSTWKATCAFNVTSERVIECQKSSSSMISRRLTTWKKWRVKDFSSYLFRKGYTIELFEPKEEGNTTNSESHIYWISSRNLAIQSTSNVLLNAPLSSKTDIFQSSPSLKALFTVRTGWCTRRLWTRNWLCLRT